MVVPVIEVFLVCLAAALVFMSLVFFIARRIKRYDLVDAAWGSVFVVIALTGFLLTGGAKEVDVRLLTLALVIVWGGRLTWHILKRIRSTTQEDPRYVELRKKWRGNLTVNVYTRIYLVQAVLALLICTPLVLINASGKEIVPLAWVGVAVWVVGFCFEVIGDRQLREFVTKSENKGKIMNRGLWRFSRHPNYFGELTQWWGIFIICLTVPYGWVGVLGPLLISYLVLFVSGIPLNEKRFEGRPGWSDYKRKTSVLLPLPPRSR